MDSCAPLVRSEMPAPGGRYLLTQHPGVEARVAAELEAAGLLATPACPEPPVMTAASIPQLPYLQAVIKVCLPGAAAAEGTLPALDPACAFHWGLHPQHNLAMRAVVGRHTMAIRAPPKANDGLPAGNGSLSVCVKRTSGCLGSSSWQALRIPGSHQLSTASASAPLRPGTLVALQSPAALEESQHLEDQCLAAPHARVTCAVHTVPLIPVLTCCICNLQETLRLYPPVGIGQLRAPYKSDIQLAGHLSIPKGTILWVPHTAIQGAKHNWDKPQAFKPGVFSPAAARSDADVMAVLDELGRSDRW